MYCSVLYSKHMHRVRFVFATPEDDLTHTLGSTLVDTLLHDVIRVTFVEDSGVVLDRSSYSFTSRRRIR